PGGEYGIAIRVRVAARLPVRDGLDARLVECQAGGDREVDRLDRLLAREPEEPRDTGHARDASNHHVVEARLLVIERIAKTAEDPVRQHRRKNQVAPARAHDLGGRERGADAVARVPAALADVAVVVVEIPDRHAIGEPREVHAGFLPAAEDARRLT